MPTDLTEIPYGYCACGCGQKTTIPTHNCTAKGWRKGVPLRVVRGHGMRVKALQRVPHESEYQIEDHGHDTPCWIWQGTLNPRDGYGVVSHKGRVRSAYRWYYEALVGPIPEGLHIDHLCRVRACVNPAHLEPVTNAENARRGDNTRLTPEQVAEIRAATGTTIEIGKRFGVHCSHVSRIRRGLVWREEVA